MRMRQSVSGRRSVMLYLAIAGVLLLAVALAAIVFVVAPERERRQQVEAQRAQATLDAQTRTDQATATAEAKTAEVERFYAAGVTFQKAGDCDRAAESFIQVINIEPDYKEAQDRLKEAQACQQTVETTATASSIAMAQATTEAQATATQVEMQRFYAAGVTFQKAGDCDRAAESFIQVINIEPDYKEAQDRLKEARACQQATQTTATAEAIAMARATADAEATAVQTEIERLYVAGVAFLDAGDCKQAIESFAQVVQKKPTFEDVQNRLKEAHACQQAANVTATAQAIAAVRATATAQAAATAETRALAQATSVTATATDERHVASGPAAKDVIAEEEEYVLGVVLPFTGPLGTFGIGFREGIELAIEQMNEQLSLAGSNIWFSMVSADTRGTPDGAAKAVQTVVQTSGTEVVVGPLTTNEALGAKQFADKNQITLVAPASSGLAGAIPGDFIFRPMHPPDSFAGQAFVQIVAAQGYENVVILQVDDPFGNSLTKIFEGGFQAAGGSEVSVVKYAADPPDLSSEITKISSEVARLAESDKTAVFCICFLGDARKVFQIAQVDPVLREVDWLGIENLHSEELLADPARAAFLADVNFTTVSFAETQNPNTQPFIGAYTAKFDHEPGPFTNYAYDAANIAMYSMVFAGNHGAAVKEVLPFIAAHYIGTQVQTYLDENGDQAIAYLNIYQVVEDGPDFVQIGEYDGSTSTVTLFNQ